MISIKGSGYCGDEQSISHCRRLIFSILILSLAIFSIYSNSFDCSWHFDDKPNITDNPNLHLSALNWDNIKRTLFSDRKNPTTLYRPAACLSFAFNYYVGGLDVFGYHLVNILVHLLTTIFLFLFLYNTLNLPSLEGKHHSKAFEIAMLATFLWALNPVQTQAVTYIVQRMASMAGMFYIMSMYFYLKTRTATCRRTERTYILLCFVSYVLALGSKENAVMVPLSLLLYETLIVQEDPGKFVRENIKILFMAFCVFLFFCLLYLIYKGESIFSFMSGYNGRPFTLTQRLLTEPRILIFYISLLIYPLSSRLSVAHSINLSTSLVKPVGTVFSILFLLAAIVCLIYKARKYSLISFCFLFFFLNHVVESTIIPLELIFEHRNYIPSMMFFVPISIWIFMLLEQVASNKILKTAISAFVVCFLISLGSGVFIRNFAWKNEKSLWADAAEKAPDQSRVHHNLGVYYQDHGDREKAISEFTKALNSAVIHVNKEMIITHFQLGQLYSDLADYKKAEFHYQKAIKIDPNFHHALNNLAALYDKEEKTDLANEYLKKALKANPGGPGINFNVGLHFLKINQPEKAIYHLKLSLNDKKLKQRTLLYLGIAYKQEGWLGEATTVFRQAVSLDRKNISPRLHLAEIYHRTGSIEMSQREASTLVSLMLHDEALFYKTIDLISHDGHLGNVHLSADVLLPLISEACDNESKELTKWKDYIKETLKKRMKINDNS